MRRLARDLCARGAVAGATLAACASPWRGATIDAPIAACPRDAHRAATSRCVCDEGRLPLMGACVTPALADTFCGPAARGGAEGCSFRGCPAGQRLDVVSGACVGVAALEFAACGEHERPLVENERLSCVPLDATCPRATRRTGDRCTRPAACPPGSLPDQDSCRPVVLAGARGRSRVDVGVWTALALGIDGGPGTPALCQPLSQRPNLFGVTPESPLRIDVGVTVTLPDQDVSALSAQITATDSRGLPLSADADSAVVDATMALLEVLRGLGGESSAAAVGVRVRCEIGAR